MRDWKAMKHTREKDDNDSQNGVRAGGEASEAAAAVPGIRVSNDRYAKDATFEEMLTAEDRRMLKEMGIVV